jgi:glycosyltransferase involved in cell wall biosynthesis
MNIALDLRRRTEFGVGTYVRNTVRAMARIPDAAKHKFILISTPDGLREFRDLPDNFILQPFPKQASSLRHALAFRNVLEKRKADLLHIPHLFKTPRFAPCPYVVTVHDLLDFIYRRHKQQPWQARFRVEMARYALGHAAGIMAVSNSTKMDLLRLFGDKLKEEKIDVAYNAIDERLLKGHATETDKKFIAERYQVNYPFVLYSGNIKPHKNIVRLIEAFSALKAELKKTDEYPNLKLIIIGDEVSKHPDLRRTVIKSGVQQDVRFLGFIPIEELGIFYDVAKVFAFPSLYEGFGLPPLEALAHGTPVVVSNTSSLPEVVGSAAILVNPENVFDIMHGLHTALVDQEVREGMKSRGPIQAKQFSWEGSARKLLAMYERAGEANLGPNRPQSETSSYSGR